MGTLKTVSLGGLDGRAIYSVCSCSKSTTYCVCGKIFFYKKIQTSAIKQKTAFFSIKNAVFASVCIL